MSPEQATAEKEISGRSDIYSLGCVLYEMLTGNPPHVGASAQQIIMKIVTEEAAPVTKLRKAVPPNVAAAVAKALEKLPADRFESARAFAEALTNAAYSAGMTRALQGTSTVGRTTAARWALLGWAVGIVGVTLAGWSFAARRAADDAPSYLNISLPESAPLTMVGLGTLGIGRRAMALSPNGKTLVYAGIGGGTERLYRRSLGGFEVTPITGTEGAYYPFFSPDGAWIGFFVGVELRKVPVAGGAAVTLAAFAEPVGADWGRDGRILVAGSEGEDLAWVSQSGGPIQPIPNPQKVIRVQPSLLPDGRHALVESWMGFAYIISVVSLETGRTEALTSGGPVPADSVDLTLALRGRQPRYLESGQLLYSSPAGLVGTRFDPGTRKVRGGAVELLDGVWHGGYGVQYVVSNNGTLVYVPGPDADAGALAWVSPGGTIDSLGFAPQVYGTFAVSPDGGRVAALVSAFNRADELWVYDLERRTETKVLVDGTPTMPRWWADGRRIVFSETSARPPYSRVAVRQLVETAGERDTLGHGWEANDISPDSSRVAGTYGFGSGAWIFPLEKGRPAIAVDSFPGAWGPDFSPDGRWVAFTSNESGRYEIYVADAASLRARHKVSLAGGEEPLWSRRGDELFYRWGQEWYAITTPQAGSSEFGRPRTIFGGPFVNVPERSHDIAPDGRRHLVVVGARQQTTTTLNVITNWREDVRRKFEQ
jgi:serine/threonine-protein kinase